MAKYCSHCMSPMDEEQSVCPACGRDAGKPVPAHHLLPGTVLNNKYYVGSALGEGGFGITYIGRDKLLDMKVAIKEFYPNGYVNRSNTVSPLVNDSVTENRREFFDKGRERFLKEARILAKFSGEPGIVGVRDFFEENNTAYIIMEFLEGDDLKEYLRKNGTLSPEQTIKLLMPVMNSLKKVHAQGLIHRDISPDNIMIMGDRVKLLDFGAARTVSAEANKSLSVMLKPGYAPEEQYRSKGQQGPWTDIYALCATMYKCITGITPDDATQRVFSDEVRFPSSLGISITPEIESAIMRGMSVHQTNRYQSIEDLLRGLQGIDVTFSGGDDVTVAGRKVSEDDKETRYMGNDDPTVFLNEDKPTQMADDERTVLAEDEATVLLEKQPEKTVKPEKKVKPSKPEKAAETTEKPKSKKTAETVDNETSAKKKSPIKKALKIVGGVVCGLVVAVIALIVVISLPEKYNEPAAELGGNRDPNAIYPIVTTVTDGSIVMSDALFDFTFELDGVVYKLPCTFQQFTMNGWTITGEDYTEDSLIEGEDYVNYYMSKDGRQIYVTSYNNGGNAKRLGDCKIGTLTAYESSGISIKLAKGITFPINVKDIRSAYGKEQSSYKGSSYTRLTYEPNRKYISSVDLSCDKIGSSYIRLKNHITTEDDMTETNTTKPMYLYEYSSPTDLSVGTPVVYVDGYIYRLPVPVSEFLDNGWQLPEYIDEYIVAGGNLYTPLWKGDASMYVTLLNLADYQTTPENCVVSELNVNSSAIEAMIAVEGGNVTMGMSKAEVSALVGDTFEYSETDYSHSFKYGEDDVYISVSCDVEKGLVDSIELRCKTWNK